MPKLIEKLFAWSVGAVALTAVTFGLAVATAKPVEALTCQNDGQSFLGQQPSAEACFQACLAVHGALLDHSSWNPTTGCCRCFY